MGGDNSKYSQLARIETLVDGGLVNVHLRSRVSRVGHINWVVVRVKVKVEMRLGRYH